MDTLPFLYFSFKSISSKFINTAGLRKLVGNEFRHLNFRGLKIKRHSHLPFRVLLLKIMAGGGFGS